MATLTVVERKLRERRIEPLVKAGWSLNKIALNLGISRQAVWEFCGRRGWLPGDHQGKYAEIIIARDARRAATRGRKYRGKKKEKPEPDPRGPLRRNQEGFWV